MKKSNLLNIEFEAMVIRILKEHSDNYKELGENYGMKS